MSLSLCILASGSAGNCAVVRAPGGCVLIDAGLGPVATARRLAGTGVGLEDIRAICLTHLDSDHFNVNWMATLVRCQMTVFCHAGRIDELKALHRRWLATRRSAVTGRLHLIPFDGAGFSPLDGLRIDPIPLPHDVAGSHGFVLEGFDGRIGYATDLGRAPTQLIERFHPLDILALESNYDERMQRASTRPPSLKARIMGGHGHLSNDQAFAAVRALLDRHERSGRLPGHVVLLHRSRQCNCPHRLRNLFQQDRRIAPRLTLAEQHCRTEWLACGPRQPFAGEQLTWGWG